VNGSLCDINQAPPACSAANTCPSAYPGCGAGVTTAVTTQNQNVCSDVDLAALRDQCPNGASDASCIAAYNILKAVDPACATCVGPFNVDFVPTFEGIFLCASPFVGNNCRHQMGCDFDCTTVSCNQCLPAQQTTCENSVQNAGQCSGFANQAFNCIFNGIGPGQPGEFCDPGQYASYGEWLFAVGKKFCGGP